jgi:hypothetical protein
LYASHFNDGQRSVKVSYHVGIAASRKWEGIVSVLSGFRSKSCNESRIALRALGWASVAVGVAALGLYVGRELRQRYKFNRRTPSDFYSHAGDEGQTTEFGMGI